MRQAICWVLDNGSSIKDDIEFRQVLRDRLAELDSDLVKKYTFDFDIVEREIVISGSMEDLLMSAMDELAEDPDFIERVLAFCDGKDFSPGDIGLPYIIDEASEEEYGRKADKLFGEYCALLGVSRLKGRLMMPSFDLNEDRYYWLVDAIKEIKGERMG